MPLRAKAAYINYGVSAQEGRAKLMTLPKICDDFSYRLFAADSEDLFSEYQAIPTNGAEGWESFEIAGETYLAVANAYDDSTYTFNINSRIYKWDGSVFIEVQAIPTNGATDWETFQIDWETYLAVANFSSGSTCNIDSRIYIAPVPAIDDILTFFDQHVADGDLEGRGCGWFAKLRLCFMRNMLVIAAELIEKDWTEAACLTLQRAYLRCDGASPPPDFVDGVAAPQLASMIQSLRASLGCDD